MRVLKMKTRAIRDTSVPLPSDDDGLGDSDQTALNDDLDADGQGLEDFETEKLTDTTARRIHALQGVLMKLLYVETSCRFPALHLPPARKNWTWKITKNALGN
ncbi:hypothetical protein DM01DRAFT_1337074 [Hesseltinella vesiculosa]|uniref:Uncharacterized protein n=1 Tax=Hesseltinella vesiculosa TaxID=101127 RepID=A0A1X2GDT7_9FUNG|nr:hypothetical protein DM01DRAFT_1337074 [Hesseltinella vesiculosa]